MQDHDHLGHDPLTAIPVPRSSRSEGPVGGERERILVVDNDTRIVELLAWFLGKRGFEVRTACNFREARERLVEGLPDLMLSDLDLGPESALEELPRLEREGLLPPTLVVSGYLDAQSTARLDHVGPVLGTLSKPFDFAALEARVVDCLRGGSAAGAPASAPSASASGAGPVADEAWVEIVPAARRGTPGGVGAPCEAAPLGAASPGSGDRSGRRHLGC